VSPCLWVTLGVGDRVGCYPVGCHRVWVTEWGVTLSVGVTGCTGDRGWGCHTGVDVTGCAGDTGLGDTGCG